MDRGAWWATVHGIAKSQTRLSNFIFTLNGLLASSWKPLLKKGPKTEITTEILNIQTIPREECIFFFFSIERH